MSRRIVPTQPASVALREDTSRAVHDKPPVLRSTRGLDPTAAAKIKNKARPIYFRDIEAVKRLETILENHPRSSLSAVIQQFVGRFLEAYESSTEKVKTDQHVSLNLTVFL